MKTDYSKGIIPIEQRITEPVISWHYHKVYLKSIIDYFETILNNGTIERDKSKLSDEVLEELIMDALKVYNRMSQI